MLDDSESPEDRRRRRLPYNQLNRIIESSVGLTEHVARYGLPRFMQSVDNPPRPHHEADEADRTPDRDDGLPFDLDPE